MGHEIFLIKHFFCYRYFIWIIPSNSISNAEDEHEELMNQEDIPFYVNYQIDG